MFKQKISWETWGGDNGKYRLKDAKGNPVDLTPEDTCKRVAKELASVEKDSDKWYDEFVSILGTKFAGGGRIMANIGAKEHKRSSSAINCVVLSTIPDSMEGILSVAKDAALTLKADCGCGYDFSSLRPKGAFVYGAGAGTSGVISFMAIFDSICNTVQSGGGRRGSQMGCLDISHPDIIEFISVKRKDGMLRCFNLSCLVTDRFFQDVENDSDWDLWFWSKLSKEERSLIAENDIKLIKRDDIPYNHPQYNYFSYADNHVEVQYKNCTTLDVFKKKIYKTLKARELFDIMMKSTYDFAEPGILMIDRANIENNLWFCETIRATNPCVSGDTRLHTNHGIVTVKELFDTQAEIKCTVDNRTLTNQRGVCVKSAVPVFKTSDNAELYNVVTKAGYEIKATEWHKFYTQRGKLSLKDIKVGDTLYIQSGEGQFGNDGSYDLGLIYGMIVGDGCFSADKKYSANVCLWGKDKCLSSKVGVAFNNLIDGEPHFGFKGRKYSCSFVDVQKKDKLTISSEILARKLINLGVDPKNKYKLPEFIWKGSRDCVKGFLQGLFQSDGFICASDKSGSCDVRLNSSEPELLKQVQVLLSNFGIYSSIYTRKKKHSKLMPDGKGGSKLYTCKDNYELIINSMSRDLYMNEIGFLTDYKYVKYNSWKKKHTAKPRSGVNKFETKIISIDFCGVEPVYDTTQDDGNSIIFNGIVTGNCGEQYLPPMSNCLLGSFLLPSYVKNAFEPNAEFDFESYKSDIYTACRLLDNVIEFNNLPLPELERNLKAQRRRGIGITGLGSVLNMIGISYNSQEAVDFAERIMKTLAQQCLFAGIELAKEKGCAPILESTESRMLFMQSGFMKRLLDSFENKQEIMDNITKYGCRFSHATSLAPTGTMSLTFGQNCSNGIEPVFSNSYMRNIRSSGKKSKVQEEICDYAYFEWKNKFGDGPLPKHWRTTNDLDVDAHINVQSVMQKWCDSSISKTVNVPSDYPFEKFKEVYIKGWKMGLKGITTFRFNPDVFSGVLVEKSDLEKTSYTFTLEDGSEVTLKGSDSVEYDGETHNVANLFDALKEGLYGNM